MIIKLPDDRRQDIAELQTLLCRRDIDIATKARIEQQLRNSQAGIRGEQEAAYEMKLHYGSSPNWMVLHDLRVEFDGMIAQIDHLVINRLLETWVCESKHFSEGVAVNDKGEFAAFYGGKPYGVPSPIEQNRRHILILRRIFDSGVINLPKRLGFTIKPDMRSLILVSKAARISRPKRKIAGQETIIKSDMLFSEINKSNEESGLMSLGKVVGCDTLEAVAKEIASLHKPFRPDWHARFGLSPLPVAPPAPVQSTLLDPLPVQPVARSPKASHKLMCFSCQSPISFNVANFCKNNEKRFGGKLFCMKCQ